MTDERSPLDAALDLVFYAPIGLVLTVGEEVPKLAAKGRSRFVSRWNTAKVVGRFAVAQGKRQMANRGGRPPAAPPRPPPPAPASWSGNGVRPSAAAPPAAPAGFPPPAPSPVPPAPYPPAPASAPLPGDLAIPGYDSLSASQVVQRLAGLAGEELEAVRTYEVATRSRRTILARVSQLQST